MHIIGYIMYSYIYIYIYIYIYNHRPAARHLFIRRQHHHGVEDGSVGVFRLSVGVEDQYVGEANDKYV